MAFIRKKTKKSGTIVYMIVESYRTQGVPTPRQRIVEYIGDQKDLEQFALECWSKSQNAGAAHEVFSGMVIKSYAHGACMGMFWMAQALNVEKIMDRVFSSKTICGQKRSRVLLLAMIHRAIDPGSKRSFASWVKETSLPYYLDFKADVMTSQTFWEAMDGISESEITEVQRGIVDRALQLAGADISSFKLDYTNYFTFIDMRNGRCSIGRLGHNKQKRDDLRQFSLAMLTSYSLQIPLIWQLYEGNKNDKQESPDFCTYVEKELEARGITPEETTITFDGGSNPAENFQKIRFHFVCAHSMTAREELYGISIDSYQKVHLSSGHDRLAYRVDDLEFSGVTGTGILTYSEDLETGQMSELNKNIGKALEEAEGLDAKLQSSKSGISKELRKRKHSYDLKAQEIEKKNEVIRRYNEEVRKFNAALDEAVAGGWKKERKKREHKEKQVPIWDEEAQLLEIAMDALCKGRKMIRSFTELSLSRDTEGQYHLEMHINEEKKAAYCKRYFGKKLIVTDHKDWSTERILEEYCEQECIETNIFRVSKETDHFAVRPQYQWTDDKIRVHVFICLTSMIIAEMLRLQMENAGIKITKAEMLDRLNEVRDCWIRDSSKTTTVTRTLETMDKAHEKLWEVAESLNSQKSQEGAVS